MDRIRIRGGRPLAGEIQIGGAKNAALPLMATGLLTEDRVILSNVPKLADIDTMTLLLAQHGVAVDPVGNDGRTLSIGGPITNTEAPYDIVRKMRASVLVLGPVAGAGGRGAGVAARRLLDRHAADRPAPEGPGATGRHLRSGRRLHRRARLRPAARCDDRVSRSFRSARPSNC